MLPTGSVSASISLRKVSLICGVLACCLAANAQSDDTEVEQQRDAFIAKVFTKCSDSVYYFGPREVNHLACVATGRNVTDCAELIEYKDLKFRTRELRLSHTDVLAQIEKKLLLLVNFVYSRSRMRVTYSTYFNSPTGSPDHRSWAPEWDPWEKPILNVMPSMSEEVVENQGTVRLPRGTKAFGILIKKRGQWTFAPGPDFPLQPSLSQVTRRVGLDGGPVADQAVEPLRGPGPTVVLSPISELMAKAGIIEKIESQKPRSCTILFPKEWPGQLSPLVAPETPMTSWAKAMLNPPRFAGTTEQFIAAFPGFLRQAAQEVGFDAQAYQKESAFVMDSVRSCAEITPAMAAQVTTRFGQVVTRTLGEKYAVCQFGGSTGRNAQYPDTQIVLQVNSGAGKNWQEGTGFTAFVFFVRAKQGNCPIVSATITGPQ
jgi:hypothetical protein